MHLVLDCCFILLQYDISENQIEGEVKFNVFSAYFVNGVFSKFNGVYLYRVYFTFDLSNMKN